MRLRNRIASMILLIFFCTTLMGCVSGFSRMSTYPQTLAGDASVFVNGTRYKIWVHRKDKTFLVQRGLKSATSMGFVEGVTLNMADTAIPINIFRIAGDTLLQRAGCKAGPMLPLDNNLTYEFQYTCEPPADLVTYVSANQKELRAGLQANGATQ